jgi:hypothetical protein
MSEPAPESAPPQAAPTPADANPAAAATRVLNPGAGDALARFQDPDLLAAGQLNLISLDAVAEVFAGRWTLQAPRVEKFVHRLLARELGGDQQFLQVSPTDILIARPQEPRAAAQVACLRLLRQVLQHFLGSSARAPDGVFQVVAIRHDQVEGHPIDRETLAAAEQAADLERERAEALARATTPFMASHGRRVTVSCELHTLVNLQTGAAIGRRLVQRVVGDNDDAALAPADLAAFAGIDRQRVDWGAAVHGLAQLRERAERAPTLVVSMSYASLSSQRGRTDMLDLLKQLRDYATHGVICEVSGVEGAPHAQMQEAISTIRPLSLFVVGRIDAPAQVVWSHLKGVGLRGLAFDCPPTEGRAEFLGWATATISRARSVAGSVLLYGVPALDLAPALSSAGATHATVLA